MEDEPPAANVSRRDLLDWLLSGGLGSLAIMLLYPVWRYVAPPVVSEEIAKNVVAAKVGELAPNSGKIFRFGSRPGLLVRTASGDWRAMSAVCTHLQCTVQYRSDREQVWCACHNGWFDLTGRNVGGPPPRPLEPFVVAVTGDDVVVSLRA